MTHDEEFKKGDEVRYIGKDYAIKKGIYVIERVDDRIIWIKHTERIDKWKVAIHELKKEYRDND